MNIPRERAAGILMHITSLPSPFGIGDLGPEAFSFAEFLHRAGQKYWQILPLTPISQDQQFSPYSSISSLAGNSLLISPELLYEQGSLTKNDLKIKVSGKKNVIDYKQVVEIKAQLLDKAWRNFKTQKNAAFEAFCDREAFWLDDFSLFVTLRKAHGDVPWYEWPEHFRNRDLKSLLKFTQSNPEFIQQVKWLQFEFFRQWKDLRRFCNDLNIRIIGDLPFYISYDSVDVWSRREIFKLSKTGQMEGIAGVPPDYFNDDGQLWGMPVYRWEVLQEHGYDWWIRRIRKNLELVDVLRLDHFRAFADYWEVPHGEQTARNGKWNPGPGSDFFRMLQQEFGKLPFIAEDLGDINAAVYRLRDQFALPGMKVIQFAFGDNMSESDHIPHNYDRNFIVYTGTHDNNTTRGWFSNEISKDQRKQVELYVGRKMKDDQVASELIRTVYSSVARTAIIPVQDILALDEPARMNTPASTKGNWGWRLTRGELTDSHETWLKEWVKFYNRV
jgi:4-alpha-glucanotransferase